MKLSREVMAKLGKKYGDSFYLLDTAQFRKNYLELLNAFRDIYPNTNIAYSYKTNYTPRLCKIVDALGGFAEVVSGMECALAIKAGVVRNRIFYNGPYKDQASVSQVLLGGGVVNLDSSRDLDIVIAIARKNPSKKLRVGLRCNFDIKDGVISRFGFDTAGKEFQEVMHRLRAIRNIKLAGLHCHFATRSLDTWPARAVGMLNLVQRHFVSPPEYISLGGGLFGKMGDSLKAQFGVRIPTYKDYARAVAAVFWDRYKDTPPSIRPELIIEPGSALAGDVMLFASRVVNIKTVRGKNIATLSGSVYNINPTLNKKNPPVTVFHLRGSRQTQKLYTDLDFGGYTCIESDYLFRGFSGKLAVDDVVVFENVGSYSLVLKPPFILPNSPVIELGSKGNSVRLVKRQETFSDLFQTFNF